MRVIVRLHGSQLSLPVAGVCAYRVGLGGERTLSSTGTGVTRAQSPPRARALIGGMHASTLVTTRAPVGGMHTSTLVRTSNPDLLDLGPAAYCDVLYGVKCYLRTAAPAAGQPTDASILDRHAPERHQREGQFAQSTDVRIPSISSTERATSAGSKSDIESDLGSGVGAGGRVRITGADAESASNEREPNERGDAGTDATPHRSRIPRLSSLLGLSSLPSLSNTRLEVDIMGMRDVTDNVIDVASGFVNN